MADELYENLDLNVYNKIRNILCRNNYYPSITNYKKSYDRNGNLKDPSGWVLGRSFVYWFLCNLFGISSDEDALECIVDNGSDKKIDAIVPCADSKGNITDIYLIQFKFVNRRVTHDEKTNVDTLWKELKKGVSAFRDGTEEVAGKMDYVFEIWNKGKTIIHILFVTATECTQDDERALESLRDEINGTSGFDFIYFNNLNFEDYFDSLDAKGD